jgi:hypothetical protein
VAVPSGSSRPPFDPFLFADCHGRVQKRWLIKSRCGRDRDCLDDDRTLGGTFSEMYCIGINWARFHPTRYQEIWTADGKRKVYTVRNSSISPHSLGRCGFTSDPYDAAPGSRAERDPFTVNVPGLTDILRVPGLETPELRKERARRMRQSNSALPKVLQWLPPILNKLDDAQDLLFTGLALAWPILKFLGPRFLGPLGWLLTINDLFNVAT